MIVGQSGHPIFRSESRAAFKLTVADLSWNNKHGGIGFAHIPFVLRVESELFASI